MPVVGDATIIVRAITDKVKGDITKGLKGLDKLGEKAGEQFGDSFMEGFADKLNEDLGDTLDKAFKDASDSATNAGRDSSQNFVNGFTDAIDTKFSDALNKALGDVDSSATGEKIGKDLNAGIMRGLGNKDEEIADLLDRAGRSSADRFSSAFTEQGDQIARSLEDALNNVDASGLRDRLGNQLAEALIPLAQDIGWEMGQDLVDGIRRGARAAGGGGLGDLISFDPSDFVFDTTERVSRDFETELGRKMSDLDVDVDLDRIVRTRGGDGFADNILDPIYKLQREAKPVFADLDNSITRFFRGGSGDGGRGLFSNFSNFKREAQAASKAFTTLYAIGQFIGPVIGVAVGGLSALVTGAVELTSIIAQGIPSAVAVASSSLSALVQAFATIKIASVGIGNVLKEGLKAATVGATKGFGSPEYVAANEKYLESLSQLGPEAQSFIKYIVSLRKEGIKLRNAAGKGLFPGLERSVQRLYKALFPSLLRVLEDTGKALGGVAEEIAKAMSTERFVRNFNKVADANNKIIEISGRVFANLIDYINAFLVAAGPVTIRFAEWVESLTASWKESLKTDDAIDGLTKKLNKSGDILAQLGAIFGNIGRGLAALGRAAAPAGQRLLDAFEGATEKFEEFTKSLEDNPKATKFFDDVATNVIAIGRLFNTLVIEFAKLGDNTAIAETAESLEPVVVKLGDILDKLTESGPAMSEFLDALLETFNLLTDSGAIDAFLDTLTLILEGLNAALSSDFGQKVLLWVGPIFAVGRALSFTLNIAKFFNKVFFGSFFNLVGVVGFLKTAVQLLGSAVLWVARGLVALLGLFGVSTPVGWVVVIVAAITALGVWLYKNNDMFKKWIDGIWSSLKDAAGPIIDFFKGLWDKIQEGWQGLVDAVSPIVDRFKEIWDNLSSAISTAFDVIKGVLEPFIVFFVGYWSIIFNIIRGAVTIFLAIFRPLLDILIGWWKLLGTVFIEGAKAIWDIFKMLASFIWNVVKTLFGALRTIFMTLFVIMYTPIKIVIGLAILAFQFLRDKIGEAIRAGMAIIKAVWGALKETFGGPVNAALAVVRAGFDFINSKIREVVNGIVTWIKPKLETIGAIFKTVFDAAKKVVKGAFDGIKSGIQSGIDSVKGFLNGFISTTNTLIGGVNKVTGAINKLPGPDIPKIPLIPKLASGGIVYPSTGGTLAVLAEAGRPERVEPLDSSGMSARDRAMIEELKKLVAAGGNGQTAIVNNYYPEPERASESLAMSLRIARGALAGA